MSQLLAGDQLTISVSHQIYVDGDQSWVKLEATTQVQEEETAKEAIKRLSSLVNAEVINVIQDAITVVRGQEK